MIAFDRLPALARKLKPEWEKATPFAHVVIDDFLPRNMPTEWLRDSTAQPKAGSSTTTTTSGSTATAKSSSCIRPCWSCSRTLESPQWLKFLEDVTGIKRLLADETLDGSSGLHKSLPGCYLKIHRESVGHNGHDDWKRQINLLLYLNKDWKREWDGELQIIDHKTMKCVKEMTPYFNRLVLFHTNPIAFHGNPKVLKSPEGTVRKSLTSYYFTQEKKKIGLQPVLYRPEPGDGAGRRSMIALKNLALRAYFPLRKYTPINDELVDKVMRKVGLSRD